MLKHPSAAALAIGILSATAAFAGAVRIGGVAARKYAQEAGKKGAETLRAAGMAAVAKIGREAFLAALKPAHAKFAGKPCAKQIGHIRYAQ